MATQRNKQASTERHTGRGPSFELKTWHCIAAIVAVVFLLFREILLGTAWLWEDMLYFSYPLRCFAATSMAEGQAPLWNPFIFNGMPFFADIQTAVFYLPLTALALFVKNGHLSFYALEVVVILHYVLAGAGMFFLALSFELKKLPALFAAIAYTLSGFMIVHAIHQQMITLVAWYPLIFLLFRKGLHEASWLPVFACALVLGHSTLAGYPQLSLFLYFFLFLYFVFELVITHRGAGMISRPALTMAARAGTVVVLSITVAMIQLLPTMELADLSQRAHITYEKASEGSLAWSQLFTLFLPKLFGTAGADGYNYWGPGTYWYYWETCIYLGILPLLLTILSLPLARKNNQVLFLWGVTVFSLLFALGDNFPLHKLFYDFVPGFAKFRIPARIGIWFTFAAALLSGFALDSMLTTTDATLVQKRRKLLIGATALGVLLSLLVLTGSLTGTFPFMSDQSVFHIVRTGVLLALVLLLSSGVVLFMLLRSPRRTGLGAAALIIMVIDLLLFAGNQNNATLNPEEYFGRAAGIVQFVKQQSKDELFRINTRNAQGMIMDRNQGMVDRIATTEGYTPLLLQRVYAPYRTAEQSLDIMNVKYKTVTDDQTHSLRFVPNPTYMPRAFFLYKFHITKDEDDLVAYLKSEDFDPRTTAVLEKDPGWTITPPVTQPVWKATITRYENNRIAIDAASDHDGILVLSEIYYPGWKAYIDGSETEIFRTNYNLRSIHVTAGTHTIEFRFEPASYRNGEIITLASLVICGIGIGVPLLRKRRSAKQTAG